MRGGGSRAGLVLMLLLLVGGLISTGLLFVQSSTRGTGLAHMASRQLLLVGMGLPLMLVAALLPTRWIARRALWFYALSLASLVLVLFLGVEKNNARRWFLGPAGFLIQPSEFAKPVLILALARFLEFRGPPRRLWDWVGPILLTLAPFLLIRREPDLGTALMLLPILAGMLYAAGARRRHFVLGACLVVPLGLLSLPFLEDYQIERIRTFGSSIPALQEEAKNARREGQDERALALERRVTLMKRRTHYQSYYGLVSIGSGGIHGKGLGQGPQNQLRYLPERHNDFVFAVVGEEAGLVGSVALLGGFLLLGFGVLSAGASTRDRFGRLVCAGVAVSLLTQALGNMAMTLGLLPITGMPLPFISQGGSSMISSLLLVGLVLGVARTGTPRDPFLYEAEDRRDPFGRGFRDPGRRLRTR